jgi:hypothetical protein
MEITLENAQEIAQAALEAKIRAAERLRAFTFDKAKFVREYPPCLLFAAHSEEMGEAGYAPAALFVYIDKQDGHVWTVAEQDDYFYAHEKQQPERIAA